MWSFHWYFPPLLNKRNAYDVRTKGQLVTPQTRIQFGDRAVEVKGCLLWNRIDKNMLKYNLLIDLPNHLRIILWNVKYLRTKGKKYQKRSVVWNFKMYSFHIYRSFYIFLISFVTSLYTFVVNCVSLFRVPPPQIWVASWIWELSGHQLDEPMGFPGGLEQQ